MVISCCWPPRWTVKIALSPGECAWTTQANRAAVAASEAAEGLALLAIFAHMDVSGAIAAPLVLEELGAPAPVLAPGLSIAVQPVPAAALPVLPVPLELFEPLELPVLPVPLELFEPPELFVLPVPPELFEPLELPEV